VILPEIGMKPKRGAKTQVGAEQVFLMGESVVTFVFDGDGLARDFMSRQPNSFAARGINDDK